MRDGESFRSWLEKHKGLSRNSAKDVLSRTRRVEKIDVDIDIPYEEIVNILNENEEFNKIRKDNQSQIIRAIKLYKEFTQEEKDLFVSLDMESYN